MRIACTSFVIWLYTSISTLSSSLRQELSLYCYYIHIGIFLVYSLNLFKVTDGPYSVRAEIVTVFRCNVNFIYPYVQYVF